MEREEDDLIFLILRLPQGRGVWWTVVSHFPSSVLSAATAELAFSRPERGIY